MSENELIIGTAPDSWGVWFPEDEKQIPWQKALEEMAEAGFSVMETGPFGYFPTDPKRLMEEMGKRGFRVVAGTAWAPTARLAETVLTIRSKLPLSCSKVSGSLVA